MAKVSLKCSSCGGVLDVDEGRNVLFCPYCGSKELLLESDAVKIEKIRSQAYTTVETTRYSTDAEVKMNAQRMELEEKKHEQKEKRRTILICFGVMIFLLLFLRFAL